MEIENERTRIKAARMNAIHSFRKLPVIEGDRLTDWLTLNAMDPETVSKAELVKIIGEHAPQWVSHCGECGEDSDQPHMVFEGYDYYDTVVCKSCVEKALEVMK